MPSPLPFLPLRLCSLFHLEPVILLLLFLGLFKRFPLVTVNIKLVITFNWRTAEHYTYRFVFTMNPQEGSNAPLMAQIRSYRLQ